jgi:hypothetical protein
MESPMRKIVAAATFGFLLSCTSYTPPPQPSNLRRQFEIAAPAEDVWRAVIRYFSGYNIPIENMDHSSFFLKTKTVDLGTTFAGMDSRKQVQIKNDWCDCGSGELGNVWSSETQITLSFNIVLETLGPSRTTARTNVFFEGVMRGKTNLRASGFDTELKLTCVSTGRLEREVAEFLGKNVAGGNQLPRGRAHER